MHKWLATLFVPALVLGAGAARSQSKTTVPHPIATTERFNLAGVRSVQKIAQLTGVDSINHTQRWGVYGQDLGEMFNEGKKTFLVFGDTFGPNGTDWRSNTMAYTMTTNPVHGLKFVRYITDPQGVAKELIYSPHVNYDEITKIPSNGVSVGHTLYLYYESINHWGPAGVWYANYAGLAESTDQGQNWKIVPNVRWPGTSNFCQVAIAKVKAEGHTELYFWGIPAGRFGSVELMRVRASEITNIHRYQYYAGTSSEHTPIWSEKRANSVPIVPGPVGELSVMWDTYLHHWIMMYLQGSGNVVMNEGVHPWGPYVTVATQQQYPELYGPFMDSRYVKDQGKYIYFTLSQYGPYNVFWMKAQVVKKGP